MGNPCAAQSPKCDDLLLRTQMYIKKHICSCPSCDHKHKSNFKTKRLFWSRNSCTCENLVSGSLFWSTPQIPAGADWLCRNLRAQPRPNQWPGGFVQPSAHVTTAFQVSAGQIEMDEETLQQSNSYMSTKTVIKKKTQHQWCKINKPNINLIPFCISRTCFHTCAVFLVNHPPTFSASTWSTFIKLLKLLFWPEVT